MPTDSHSKTFRATSVAYIGRDLKKWQPSNGCICQWPNTKWFKPCRCTQFFVAETPWSQTTWHHSACLSPFKGTIGTASQVRFTQVQVPMRHEISRGEDLPGKGHKAATLWWKPAPAGPSNSHCDLDTPAGKTTQEVPSTASSNRWIAALRLVTTGSKTTPGQVVSSQGYAPLETHRMPSVTDDLHLTRSAHR